MSQAEKPQLSAEQQRIVEAVQAAAGNGFVSAKLDAAGAVVVEVQAEATRPVLEKLRELGITYLSTMHGMTLANTSALSITSSARTQTSASACVRWPRAVALRSHR